MFMFAKFDPGGTEQTHGALEALYRVIYYVCTNPTLLIPALVLLLIGAALAATAPNRKPPKL